MLEVFLRLGMLDAWMTDSDRGKLKLIAELLCIKHHHFSLELFNAHEVHVAIEFLCTLLRKLHSFLSYFFCYFLIVFYCVLLYELHVK